MQEIRQAITGPLSGGAITWMCRNNLVKITYFSDILCVWAYVAQRRLVEVATQFGDDVQISYRFCSVFGNSADTIRRVWSEKGGYEGFNRHLQDVVTQFNDIDIHPDVWLKTRPASSDSAHLFIKAVQILEENGDIGETKDANSDSASQQLIWQLRCAFFHECRDVATRKVQYELAEQVRIPRALIEVNIDNGTAFTALSADYQEQQRLKVEGSPTFVLNQGRQKLYGNLGYRVIEANIRELLRTPGVGEMSWC